MTVHQGFADWYRSAAITPPQGLIEKRWAGVETLAAKPDAQLILGLALLFTLPNPTESVVPPRLREVFRSQDDGFPSKDNFQELRVLSGAALRIVIEQGHPPATLAALALACGAFGPRQPLLSELEHLHVAQTFLLERSRSVRRTTEQSGAKVSVPTKSRIEELLPSQPNFASNQTQQIHQPLMNTFLELANGLSAARALIEQLTQTVRVRDEEVNVLWWLQTRFSRDLGKTFTETGYEAGSLIFPMEVADLTVLLPGLEAVVAVLVHALHLSGAPSSSEAITIANATNKTPRQWRERLRVNYRLDRAELLCPLMLAIQKSLETDGPEDWLPVYRKACDIPADKPYPLVQIAVQLYRERMLLKALSEATS